MDIDSVRPKRFGSGDVAEKSRAVRPRGRIGRAFAMMVGWTFTHC
ncbi:hypothetical protein BBSC_1360 [Bifidobacterium scardovii JCM 12489 = DSM 13734]|nr:hypothetical protein BBSC_1360 [Bifidobacterium scardovii JCM 12489 = DSM 13734]